MPTAKKQAEYGKRSNQHQRRNVRDGLCCQKGHRNPKKVREKTFSAKKSHV